MPAVEILMDPDLSVIPSAFQIVAEGVAKGTRSVNRRVLDGMYQTAASIFEQSIERPATSVTAGGRSYRAGSRATGSFTFGDGETFQGSMIDNGPVQGIAFPHTGIADQNTRRAWRVLEQGTDSMRIPVGTWRDPGGRTVPWGQGFDDEFYPGKRGGFREASGITGKFFIQGAIEYGAEALEQAYEELAESLAEHAATHTVAGYYRNVTRTVYVSQEVQGYTRKDGVKVQSYIRQVPQTIIERVYVPPYTRSG